MRLSRRIGLLWMPVALLAMSLMIIPLALPEKVVA